MKVLTFQAIKYALSQAQSLSDTNFANCLSIAIFSRTWNTLKKLWIFSFRIEQKSNFTMSIHRQMKKDIHICTEVTKAALFWSVIPVTFSRHREKKKKKLNFFRFSYYAIAFAFECDSNVSRQRFFHLLNTCRRHFCSLDLLNIGIKI